MKFFQKRGVAITITLILIVAKCPDITGIDKRCS